MADKKNIMDVFKEGDEGEKKEEEREHKEEKEEEREISPTPPPKVPQIKKVKEEFDTTPAEKLGKHTISIYGLKGSGKTYCAFTFPGTYIAFTFDNKTQSIANEMPNKDQITVFNGVKYYNRTGSSEEWLRSAEVSWKYINFILDNIGTKIPRPDWILIDGGEIVHSMLEMVMRFRNGLGVYQGIANKNIWKERRVYIETLLHRSQELAKKGVIWTSYIDKDEIKEDGDFTSVQDVPRWIDAVLYETDVLIKTERKTGKMSQEFYATVESSKWKAIPETGRILLDDKGANNLIKNKKLYEE